MERVAEVGNNEDSYYLLTKLAALIRYIYDWQIIFIAENISIHAVHNFSSNKICQTKFSSQQKKKVKEAILLLKYIGIYVGK